MNDKPYLCTDTIPEQLKALSNFILWKLEKRDGKETKVPYQPNGNYAKTNDPATWSNFYDVTTAYKNTDEFTGIGICLDDKTPIGIDLDHCRCPAFNLITPWAQTIINEIGSYSEVSPSGKGIRIFANGGPLPPQGRKKGPVEVYEAGRYLTVTGNHVNETPTDIKNRPEAILAFHRRYFGDTQEGGASDQTVHVVVNTDMDERLEKAFSSRNGDRIKQLYEGNISDYPSPSEADLALCSHLAFWLNKDSILMDQAFRSSGLMRPKWDGKHFADGQTYGQSVIAKAVASCKQAYNEGAFSPDSGINLESVIQRLAVLSPLQYERARKAEARALRVRAPILDALVKAARKGNDVEDLVFDEVEPWPEPVDPAILLNDILSTIRRFIVCSEAVSIAVTLWTAMTWFIDQIDVAPLAVITAPEKRCGKSLLLSILGRLVSRPLTASNISSAALFRTIDKFSPTLLIDEADTFMRDNEELRGLLNSGHTRDSAYVIRVVGENLNPTKFNTWGAKAIAGIGHVADTIMDRSIPLELRRRLPNERVERIRHADPKLFNELKAKLARFAEDYSERVKQAAPPLPVHLNDRAQDNWEPLLAIAMVAGGNWLEIGTDTALKLSASESASPTTGVELLSDIQQIFIMRDTDRIFSDDLIKALCVDNEKRWASYDKGRWITPRQLANQLKKYGITSKSVRVGSSTAKGYIREHFTDAFFRYVVTPPENMRHTSQPLSTEASRDFSAVTHADDVTDEKQRKLLNINYCYPVTDKIPFDTENVFLDEEETIDVEDILDA